MASTAQFKQYLWLVDTVYSAGEITRDVINRKWGRSIYNDTGTPIYVERTFHRHRADIASIFGINIECNKSKGSVYYIANWDDLDYASLRSWLIDTVALNNLVAVAGDLHNRIIFEEIPEGTRYLSSIVTAMHENRKLFVTYQRFDRTESHSFLLAPYCLRACQKRWYLIGKPEDHPEESEPRVYSLDRVKVIASTDQPFKLPHSFDAQDFFYGYFGVDRRQGKPQLVRIRVDSHTAKYIRTLPLHHS